MDAAPRVGDGLIRLDADGMVTYASPNALSAYHRLGLTSGSDGRSPRAHHSGVVAPLAWRGRTRRWSNWRAVGLRGRPKWSAQGGVVPLRAIPLQPKGVHTGSLVLVRDVTELRRRERELMTKDATIREIHHRVKNNLQTVAALLRLQARRLDSPKPQGRAGGGGPPGRLDRHRARDAVADPGRAGRLRRDRRPGPGDGDGAVGTPRARCATRRSGSFGILSADVATPLAMVLTELLQNALEHAFGPKDSGRVEVSALRGRAPATGMGWSESWNGGAKPDEYLLITVQDNGRGMPEGFDPQKAGNLGLQIVRTLATGELGGTFDMVAGPDGGTKVVLEIPVR